VAKLPMKVCQRRGFVRHKRTTGMPIPRNESRLAVAWMFMSVGSIKGEGAKNLAYNR